jgi:hypothetical protein
VTRPVFTALGLALTMLRPAAALQSENPDTTRAPLFQVGELLKYDVRLGVIQLGTAELRVVGIDTIRGTPSAHIHFRIRGGTFFYDMDNRMDSWVALSDSTSRRFTQDFNENRKERHAWYDILPDSGYYREKGVDSPKPTVAKPLDDLAFFYFARTVPLIPGQKLELPRYFRPDRNPVILDVKSRETIDTPAGKFPSIVLQPIIKGGGILKEASKARMWLSDDDRRLMVQLKSKFPVGTLTMRLIAIEGPPSAKRTTRSP